MFAEDTSGTSYGDHVSTLLAHTDVVYPTAEAAGGTTDSNSGNKESLNAPIEADCPPIEPEATTSGMQSIRKHFTNCKVPEAIADMLMHCWRPGTQKQYDVYVKKWTTFCHQQQINSLQPDVNNVLTFLQGLFFIVAGIW